MLQDFTDISSISESQLTEEEALQLADELSGKLSEGEIPKSDAESLKRMVAGLGDARGALRLTFAKSLGAVGDEALPILCKALRQHQNVIVRRASAKTLNLIGNKDALPYLLEAFLEDDDPVVLGSSAGAMATIGPDAMDSLLGILKNPDCTPFQVGLINLALSFHRCQSTRSIARRLPIQTWLKFELLQFQLWGDQIQKSDNLRAQNRVFQALEDVSADVRAEAVTLIGKSCDAEDVETLLLKKLSDEDTQVRKNTALSLMKLDALGAIEQLKMAEQKEDDPDVKAVLKVAINILSAKNG